MKILFVFSVVFIILLTGCSFQSNDHSRLKVDKLLNFGSIKKGSRRIVKLKIENLSSEFLEVVIGTSCSCTSIYNNKVKIKGHTKKNVPLSLYADSTKSYISEIVTIKLNNPKEFYSVQIKARVK